jgi:hypothetical protein
MPNESCSPGEPMQTSDGLAMLPKDSSGLAADASIPLGIRPPAIHCTPSVSDPTQNQSAGSSVLCDYVWADGLYNHTCMSMAAGDRHRHICACGSTLDGPDDQQ